MAIKEFGHSTILDFAAVSPYDFLLTVRKPGGWSLLTPQEVFEKDILWTVMRAPTGKLYGLKLKSLGTVEKPKIRCQLYSDHKLGEVEKTDLSHILGFTLNLNEDLREFYALAEHDSLVNVLAKDLYGLRNTKSPDLFSRLILAVTLQMAPISRSDQMMELLISEYGEKVKFDGKEIMYWPAVATIAKARVKDLERKCKLGYRAKSLRAIAETIREGFPSLQELEAMSPDEAKTKLMDLKGIGDYSADIVSPHFGFALDVWSAKIFSMLMLGKEPENPREVIPKLKKVAERRWGKWRGYVFIYVLHDLKNLSRRYNLKLTEV
jgi:3-methyladenine DNA glycosylase/8-oxoguanine DNA glycosylase